MTIQYTAPGFESTTFGTQVSSHDNWTRAPARKENTYFAMVLRNN